MPNLVPGYADIAFHIGSLLYDLKQPQAAIGYVKRGLDLDTGHVGEAGQHGYTLLARIYIGENKLTDAKARSEPVDRRQRGHDLREGAAREDRSRRLRSEEGRASKSDASTP